MLYTPWGKIILLFMKEHFDLKELNIPEHFFLKFKDRSEF